MNRHWTIGEAARIAGVTVRTLHHYDDIGLLVPSERSAAGYRLYAAGELERLHQILLYRELDLPLEAIRRLLDEPAPARVEALRAQRERLVERRSRTDAVLRAVDRTLAAWERGEPMSTEELFEGFVDLADAPEEIRNHHRAHAREAHERWGDTEHYRTSMRRAGSYSKQQWTQIQREGEEAERRMAALLDEGVDPRSEEARAGAEAMRRHIDRWFYPCDAATHVGLADMYLADPRFRKHYDDRAEGLAEFVAAAIHANAEGE